MGDALSGPPHSAFLRRQRRLSFVELLLAGGEGPLILFLLELQMTGAVGFDEVGVELCAVGVAGHEILLLLLLIRPALIW